MPFIKPNGSVRFAPTYPQSVTQGTATAGDFFPNTIQTIKGIFSGREVEVPLQKESHFSGSILPPPGQTGIK